MTAHWFFTRDGKQRLGPFTSDQLRQLASGGLLDPSHMVLKVGVRKWVPAGAIRGLFPPTPSAPPPAIAAPTSAAPATPCPPTTAGQPEPHRGVLILTLGVLSLLFPILAVVLGPLAWEMGSKDVKKMRAGVMDSEGYEMTQTGRLCGLFVSLFYLLLVSLFLCIACGGLFHRSAPPPRDLGRIQQKIRRNPVTELGLNPLGGTTATQAGGLPSNLRGQVRPHTEALTHY
jgi:hypothetical protein